MAKAIVPTHGIEIDLDSGALLLKGPNRLTTLAEITWQELESLPAKLRDLVNVHRGWDGHETLSKIA
ncbi:MAG: hypothetical protein ACRBBW_13075 [Cellvibrionaceae bacterium]